MKRTDFIRGMARGARRGGRLTLVVILPFIVVATVGFLISWVIYLSGARQALRDTISIIALETSQRIEEKTADRLGTAMAAISFDAAFLDGFEGSLADRDALHRLFARQLRENPGIAILAVGLADGEYVEAQLLEDGSIRLGESGAATGGDLAFRTLGADGSFGELFVQKPDYDPRERPWYRAAMEAGGLAWSSIFSLYSNAEPAISAARPLAGGKGVVCATVTLGSLSDYLADMREASQGIMFIEDEAGRIVASSLGQDSVVSAAGAYAQAIHNYDPLIAAAAHALAVARSEAGGGGDEAFRFGFTEKGERYIGDGKRLDPSIGLDWSVTLAYRESHFFSALVASDRRTILIQGFFIILITMTGWLIVGYLVKPIQTLSGGVDILEPGLPTSPELHSITLMDNEIGQLARSFLAMKVRLDDSFGSLESSLREKEVLLKEVHHRVKNNLQIVSSILSIQASTLKDEDAREAFEECQSRIQAMALVHEEVYRSNSFAELDMAVYIRRICDSLCCGGAWSAAVIDIRVETDEKAFLALERSIPCGLVINELVTNALKYAFQGQDRGVVTVSFRRDGGEWAMSVADDGRGMPDEAGLGDGIGSQLVAGLVAQLGGSLRYGRSRAGGTDVQVRFPA